MNWVEDLKRKINDRSVVVGIIGLGYVGLPLAVAFSRKYEVVGFDTNEDKIKLLEKNNKLKVNLDNEDNK